MDAEEVRRRRIDRLEGRTTTEERAQSATRREMVNDSSATLPSVKKTRRRERGETKEERQVRKRRERGEVEEGGEYVYGRPGEREKKEPTVRVSETRKLGRDGESSSEEEGEERTPRGSTKERPREKKIKVVYVTREEQQKSRHREKEPRVVKVVRARPDEEASSVHRSSTQRSRRTSVVEVTPMPPSPPRRTVSSRVSHSDTRLPLRRSHTTSSHVPSTKSTIPSTVPTSPIARRTSIIGTIFGPGQPQHREPEKLVECLTCLSDDVPRSKSAKLRCGHRMCHSCLRRIFKLSVTDPQHMPPKCCTAEHIPLKHVEKLFDNNFKKTWNRKFQEFSTKNRIYCPARRCGEWIKPGSMHKEDGRKYGKCSRCKTKVCCTCNGKWHGSKDCPKDEETNRLLQTAKDAGWQRCYNCRTMVELKEGCNHMTCRCRAEFCMICGLKWKSCNCPWFNYEAVEEDRLAHMRVPDVLPLNPDGLPPRRLRRPRPDNHNEELTDAQRQERRDEALARRLQRASLNEGRADDYQGGIGDIHGIGNGAGHFMNQDYVRAAHNILTGDFRQANVAANYVMGVANARAPQRPMAGPYPGPPPPLLRRHTVREQEYNEAQTRASERVVPRRSRTDYESEAAVHAPPGRAPMPPPPPRRTSSRREPKVSELAGLGGRGNRVSAWRSHVEVGVEPEEGVLSMVS